MKRGLLWLLPAVGIAAVAWLLLGQGGPDVTGPGLDPGQAPESGEREEATARLAGRDLPRPAAAPSPAGFFVRGIVVDESDRPLPGVPVEARWEDRSRAYDPARSALARAFTGRLEPGEAVERVESAADGTFVFTRLTPDERWLLEARPEAPFVGARQTVWPRRSLEGLREIRLRVWRGSALRLRVVDAKGQGLKAFVAARGPWPRSDLGSFFVPERPTGTDGRLVLPAVPPPAVGLAVRVPGRFLVRSLGVDTPAKDEVVVRIGDEADAPVAGRVLDTDGRPIPGARVLAAVVPHPRATWTDVRTEAMASAGVDGAFEIRDLPAGFLQSVVAEAPGHCPRTVERGNEPLEAGRTTQVDVVLLRGASLSGRVLDEEGRPIPSAEVSVGPSDWRADRRFRETATADARGGYRVEGLPPGNVVVRATADGFYLSATTQIHPFAPAERGLAMSIEEEGAVLERDLVMKRGVPVEGRVVGPAGEAVSGAVVEAAAATAFRGWSREVSSLRQATADAEGRFVFAGLAPAPDWVFQARRAGLCSARSDPVTLAEDQVAPAVLELVVRPSATLGGRVLDVDDRPVSGVSVSLEPRNVAAPTRSDATGRFVLRGLPAGTYTVKASGGLEQDRAEVERTLDWGASVDDVIVRVPVSKSISGVLVDEAGEPFAGQTVMLEPLDPRRWRGGNHAYTDGSGAFTFERVASGRYRVRVGGVRLVDTVVEPGDTALRLVVTAASAIVIEGTVLDPDGRPVPSGQLTVWVTSEGGGRSGSSASIASGRFRTELPAGTTGKVGLEIRSTFDLAGRPIHARPLRVDDVDPRGGPLELRLQRGRTLEGRVVDEAGQGVEGVRVSASAGSQLTFWYPARDGGVVTDAEGRFRIVGLGDAEVSVHVQPPPDYAPPDGVKAVPGQKDVVIRLEAASVLEGRVVGPDGEGVAGAQVTAMWQPEGGTYQHRMIATGTDGSFRLEGLGKEPLSISVGAPHSRDGQWPYVPAHGREVAPGETGLVIELETGVWVEGEVVAPGGGSVGTGSVTLRRTDPAGRRRSERATWKPGGTFEVGPVPPGEYELRADPNSGAFRASEIVTVAAPATGVRLVLQAGAEIEGRILGSDVERYQVTFVFTTGSPRGRSRSTRVRNGGGFFFGSLEPGTEGVLFARRTGDDRYAFLEGVRADGDTYELTLSKGASIAGRVAIDVSAEDAEKLQLSVNARGPHGIQVSTRYRGRRDFVLTGLPPGAYRVQVGVWGISQRLSFAPIDDVAAGTMDLVFEPK